MAIRVDVKIEGDKTATFGLQTVAMAIEKTQQAGRRMIVTNRTLILSIRQLKAALSEAGNEAEKTAQKSMKAAAAIATTATITAASVRAHNNRVLAPPIQNHLAAAGQYMARAKGAFLSGDNDIGKYWLNLHNQQMQQNGKQPPAGGPSLANVLRAVLWSVSPSGHLNMARLVARLMSSGGGGYSGGGGGAAVAGSGGFMARVLPLLTNPVALALAALAAVIVGLGVAATMAEKQIGALLKNMAHAGDIGSGRDSVAAIIIGQATGLGPGAAGSFGENIRHGAAAGFAAGAGINPVGGPFGDINYAAKFRKYSMAVANASSYEKALRMAHAVGQPELANLYWLSNSSKQKLATTGTDLSPAQRRSQVEWQFQLARAQQQFDRIVRAVGSPALRTAAMAMEGMANALEKVNWDAVGAFVTPFFTALAGLSDAMGGSKSKGLKTSIDSLDDSTNSLNRTMKDYREIIGGDRRANGTIPKSLNWKQIQDIADQKLKIKVGVL